MCDSRATVLVRLDLEEDIHFCQKPLQIPWVEPAATIPRQTTGRVRVSELPQQHHGCLSQVRRDFGREQVISGHELLAKLINSAIEIYSTRWGWKLASGDVNGTWICKRGCRDPHPSGKLEQERAKEEQVH